MGVAAYLSRSSSLQIVELSNNSLGAHAIGVAKHLSHAPSLKQVDLLDNILGKDVIIAVNHLSRSSSIQIIVFSKTAITDDEQAAITKAINAHNEELQNYNILAHQHLWTEIKDHEGCPLPTQIVDLIGDYLPSNNIIIELS